MVERRKPRSRKARKTIPDMPPLPVLTTERMGPVVPGMADDTVVPADDLVLQLVRAMTTLTTEYQRLTTKLKEHPSFAPPTAAPPPLSKPTPAPSTPPAPRVIEPRAAVPALRKPTSVPSMQQESRVSELPELPEPPAAAPVQPNAIIQTAVASRVLQETQSKLASAKQRAQTIEKQQAKVQSKLGALKQQVQLASPENRLRVAKAIETVVYYGGQLNKQLGSVIKDVKENETLQQTAQTVLEQGKALLTSDQVARATEVAKALPQTTVDFVKRKGIVQALKRFAGKAAEWTQQVGEGVAAAVQDSGALPAPKAEAVEGVSEASRVSESSIDSEVLGIVPPEPVIILPPGNTTQGLQQRLVYQQLNLGKQCAILSDAQVCNDTGVCRMDGAKCVKQDDAELFKRGVPTTQKELSSLVLDLRKQQLAKVQNKAEICKVNTEAECASLPDGPCVWTKNQCKQLKKKYLEQNGWPTKQADIQDVAAEFAESAAPAATLPALAQLQTASASVEAATAAVSKAQTQSERDDARAVLQAAQTNLVATVKTIEAQEAAKEQPIALAQTVVGAAAAATGVPEAKQAVSEVDMMLEQFATFDAKLPEERKEQLTELSTLTIRLFLDFCNSRNEFAKPLQELETELSQKVSNSPEHTKLWNYVRRRQELEAIRQETIKVCKEEIEMQKFDLLTFSSINDIKAALKTVSDQVKQTNTADLILDSRDIESLKVAVEEARAEAASAPSTLQAEAQARADMLDNTMRYKMLVDKKTRLESALNKRERQEYARKLLIGENKMIESKLEENFIKYDACDAEQKAISEQQYRQRMKLQAEKKKHSAEQKSLQKQATELDAEYKECNKPCEEMSKVTHMILSPEEKEFEAECARITQDRTCFLKKELKDAAQAKLSAHIDKLDGLESEFKMVYRKIGEDSKAKAEECETFRDESRKYYELFSVDLKAKDVKQRLIALEAQLEQAANENYGVDRDYVTWCEIIANAKKQLDEGDISETMYAEKTTVLSETEYMQIKNLSSKTLSQARMLENFILPETALKFVELKNTIMTVVEAMQGIMLEAQGEDTAVSADVVDDPNDPNVATDEELLAAVNQRINAVVQRAGSLQKEAATTALAAPEPVATMTAPQTPPLVAVQPEPQPQPEWQALLEKRREFVKHTVDLAPGLQSTKFLEFDKDILTNLKGTTGTCATFNYADPKRTRVECLARDPYCTLSDKNTCEAAKDSTLFRLGVPKTFDEYRQLLKETSLTEERAVELVLRLKQFQQSAVDLTEAARAEQGFVEYTKSRIIENIPRSIQVLGKATASVAQYASAAVRFGWKYRDKVGEAVRKVFPFAQQVSEKLGATYTWLKTGNNLKTTLMAVGMAYAFPAFLQIIPGGGFVMSTLYSMLAPTAVKDLIGTLTTPLTVTNVYNEGTPGMVRVKEGGGNLIGTVLGYVGLANPIETALKLTFSPYGFAALVGLSVAGAVTYLNRPTTFDSRAKSRVEQLVKNEPSVPPRRAARTT